MNTDEKLDKLIELMTDNTTANEKGFKDIITENITGFIAIILGGVGIYTTVITRMDKIEYDNRHINQTIVKMNNKYTDLNNKYYRLTKEFTEYKTDASDTIMILNNNVRILKAKIKKLEK